MTNKCCRPIWVSHVRVSSHPVSATNIIGEKAEKCNCSEQRLNDVSADRSGSGLTTIAAITIVNCL